MSDATTETTTTYVYAPGLEARSIRLRNGGLVHLTIGLLGAAILAVPGMIELLAFFTFWALPVGIGSFVTGFLGLRVGFKNFRGYYVSPMVWGATAVVAFNVVAALTMFLAGYSIGSLSTYLMGCVVVGAVVSLVMAIAGFARSGRRTITCQL